MNVLRMAAVLVLGMATFQLAARSAAQEPVAPAAAPADDQTAIYRYDPFLREMIAVPTEEVKPGYLYTRFSPQLKRRVWSVARSGGGFEFAMATGSIQPAWRLDLRATAERQMEELRARAPELAQVMDIRGSRAFVQLDDAGEWQLVVRRTIASVYDEETLRRWEWHGERRVPVMHTLGYEWLLDDGKFTPATIGESAYGFAYAAHSCCW